MADDISPEDLDRDLGSATYTRIYEALTRFEQMAERNALLGFYPSLTADTFEGMDRIDDALVSLAINLIYRRIGFDPEFTMEKRAREILDINLRFGSHYASFQHALLVKISNFPGLEAREAMTALCARGISGEHEKKAAKWLVSYLMDHEETRPTVVQFLGRMKDRDDLEPVVDYVRPTLTPEEREKPGRMVRSEPEHRPPPPPPALTEIDLLLSPADSLTGHARASLLEKVLE